MEDAEKQSLMLSLLRPFLISLFRHISNQCCFSSHQFLKLFFQFALIFQDEMELPKIQVSTTVLFTNFSKAPNWGQMLNYVFPITPFSTFLMSFCFFVTGQFQSYLATCPFGMSVIKNRVGYFAFTFGFVVYVVTHSDRLLTLHVAY